MIDSQLITIVLFVLQGLMAVIGGAVMWWINTTWNKVATVERQLHLFEVRVAGQYVSSAQLHEIVRPIMEYLKTIEDKLDQKADKP